MISIILIIYLGSIIFSLLLILLSEEVLEMPTLRNPFLCFILVGVPIINTLYVVVWIVTEIVISLCYLWQRIRVTDKRERYWLQIKEALSPKTYVKLFKEFIER